MISFSTLPALLMTGDNVLMKVLTWTLAAVLSLVTLYLLFRFIIPLFTVFSPGGKPAVTESDPATGPAETTDDENAAIAMALYLCLDEIHDEESNVITIRRVSRIYSPWSSKLYSMRNLR